MKLFNSSSYQENDINFELKPILDHKTSFTSGLKTKILAGMHMIIGSLRAAVTPVVIQDGYRKCGQFPYNFNSIVQTSTYPLQPEQINIIESAIPRLVQQFRAQGTPSEELMDECSIPSTSNPGEKPKDQRPISRRRSVILNHPNTIQWYRQYKGIQSDATPQVLDCEPETVEQPTDTQITSNVSLQRKRKIAPVVNEALERSKRIIEEAKTKRSKTTDDNQEK
jgi:hypothetical protein